ncbi:MAG: tol-pal system-associated acyl-CoA thioesterase [Proteobacteria bacterium]|nr:tol-pal system-associated acyl-CoA thioesterase [Pseudomonadota bacterium]
MAEFSWPLRVYWEDTDAGGIVFYANYLRYFERARTEWLRAAGVQQQALPVLFVVTETRTRYLKPARLDDLLRITVARHTEHAAERASLSLIQRAWRGDDLLAEAEVRIACVDRQTMRPKRIPIELP